MPADKLSPKVFTDAVEPFIEFLKKKFDGKPVCVSDIKDKFGNQYVDLVQEGGGVHGVALAGYTYVLEKMGIRFMKMAGTSAGSINTLLLNAVYTKQEAEDLGKAGNYYETRSEKVLEYLANKPLSEMVDGHPMWRKLLLNMFSGTVGMGGIIKSLKKLKNRAIMAGLCLLLLVVGALGLAFYREPNIIFFGFKWVTILSAILLLVTISYIIGRIVFVQLLYKHGEWLGINPGDDFENWIKEKVLEDNGIYDVNDLKKKLKEEAENFKYRYDTCASIQLVTPPVEVETESFKTILEKIKDTSVKVDEIFDHMAAFLSRQSRYATEAEVYQLQLMLDAFEKRLAADDSKTITKEIVIVSSDITHEVKVEFPGMHQMYWGDDYSISPAKYVRASMSVPFFFKPFQIDFNPGEMLTIKREWLQYMKVQTQMEPCALLVDGGMLSNFPINVFYNPEIPVPRKPTFGIKLEYDDDTAPKSIKSLVGLGGKLVSTMRFFYDREFILKHDMYKKTVRSIDTGNIHWLNFNLTDEEKIELFFRGALAATLFLAKHAMTETEVKEMIALGKKVKFNDRTFSIFHNDAMVFKTEDCLVENSTFEWRAYKLERLLDRAAKNDRSQHLKRDAS
jgi:NTE family protein